MASKLTTCPVCQKVVSCHNFSAHKQIHDRKNLDECRICKRILSKKNMTRHVLHFHKGMETINQIENRSTESTPTGRSIQEASAEASEAQDQNMLRFGMLIRGKVIKLRNCEDCGKDISSKNFASHQKKHTGNNKKECSVCSVIITEKNMIRHMGRYHRHAALAE
ncbi:hypothetical protein GGS21DRAFT_183657 [Xylaria nigripes]|nr:hypothetical protein GGS21DRAFT_183657 [Xylaria nigripes]